MAAKKLPARNFFEKHRDKIAFGGPCDCWPWTGWIARNGYGRVKLRGNTRSAHREAYEAVHGDGSAEGLVVRHKCDNRPCINPDHLEIGTQADNIRDRDERGRQFTPKGEAHSRSKLTDADVWTIRAEYVPRSKTHDQAALAKRFGVHQSVISRIVRRALWAHMT